MSLTRALLSTPSTPAAAIAAIADGSVPKDLRHLLLAHPELPDDHPALGGHSKGDLSALRVAHITPARRAQLLGLAGPTVALDYLAVTTGLPSTDVLTIANLTRARTRTGTVPRSAAWRLLIHPASLPELQVEALTVLVSRNPMREVERHVVAATALRHPYLLPVALERARDPALLYHLTRYASTTNPHRAWLANETTRLTDVPDVSDVVEAVERAADPDLAAWAVSERPEHDVLVSVLSSYRLPDTVKHAALDAIGRHSVTRTGTLLNAAALPLRTAPADVVRTYVHGTASMWQLPNLDTLAAIDEPLLDEIWSTTRRLRQAERHTWSQLHSAADGTGWALLPAASATLRAEVEAVVLDYGCSAGADHTWRRFSPAQALDALANVRHHGHAGAGLCLPVPALHGRGGALYTPLAVAALEASADALANPVTARTLVALAPEFSGTIGELVAAASAVAG